MKEKDLKLAVSDYLEYGTNQGRWYADRLNSGEVIVVTEQGRRRVRLCRGGTADFFVIRKVNEKPLRIIFLELKGDKGKQSLEQKAFQKIVEMQGVEYYIIRSIDELASLWGDE